MINGKGINKIGLTIPDFLRMSIMQFNQTGEINIKVTSQEDQDLKIIRQSAATLNEMDWTPKDAKNFKNPKPVTN
jgi:antitoxin component of RelBE/YafQ-DinJ toxin-antitoxin module